MAILDIEKYSNHLELFKISSKEIENKIQINIFKNSESKS